MVSCTDYLFGEDEMALEMEIGNSCITMWMNVVYLNCAPKNAQNGNFMLCVFFHQFLKVVGIPKDCPETLLSWRRYLPPSPGVQYLQPVNIRVSQRLCTNHVAVLWERFQQAVRGSVSTRTMLRAPPLCRGHLPISLPSLHPTPLFHSLRLFKHDAKDILKSWIH